MSYFLLVTEIERIQREQERQRETLHRLIAQQDKQIRILQKILAILEGNAEER